MKLKFVRAYRPKGDATDIRAYSDGEVVTFEGAVEESYARKYIARGVAVDVTNEKKADEVKAAKPAPEAPASDAAAAVPFVRSHADVAPAAAPPAKEPFSLKKK